MLQQDLIFVVLQVIALGRNAGTSAKFVIINMVVDVTSCATDVSDIQLPHGSGPSRYRALRVQRHQLTLTGHVKHRLIGRCRVPLVGALKVVCVPGVSSVERQCVVQRRLMTARRVGAYL